MKAYLFWYISAQGAITEYVYVIAVSYKQAKYYWFNYLKYTLGYAYDYDLEPCNEVEAKDFVRRHNVGDILGQNAVI